MSILIEDFIMPKYCNVCPFKICDGSTDSFLCLALGDRAYLDSWGAENGTYERCPLTESPDTTDAQEDSPAILISIGFDEYYGEWFKCPACGYSDIMGSANYCPSCGVKVRIGS